MSGLCCVVVFVDDALHFNYNYFSFFQTKKERREREQNEEIKLQRNEKFNS